MTKKRVLSLLLLLVVVTASSAQKPTTITIKTPAPAKTKEVFQVQKENPAIKNGGYKKYKYKKLIESGYYRNNFKDSSWKIFSQNGTLIANGSYSKDNKTGVWNYFSKTGILVQQYDHDKDSLMYFDITEEKKYGNAPMVFPDTAMEQLPIFIGGTCYMFTLIENNLIYPKEAWLMERKAKVYIMFIVDTYGNTTDVKSEKKVGYGFDEEAIKMVSSFGKAWIPGIQKGKKVNVQYKLPIQYSMK